MRNIRLAVRTLVASTPSTIAILLCLASVVGLNAAVFGFIDQVILRPFPYTNPHELVVIWGSDSLEQRRAFSGVALNAWRQRLVHFERVAPFQLAPFRFSLDAVAGERMDGALVGTDAFAVLGVAPAMGRGFVQQDAITTPTPVILSHNLWKSHYLSNRNIVGTHTLIDGKPHTVIGVMAEGFFFPDYSVQLWQPIDPRSDDFLQVQAVGRLRVGADIRAGKAEVETALGAVLERVDSTTRTRFGVFPLHSLVVARHEQASWMLYGLVNLLLVCGSANISIWLLGRSTRRSPEVSTRLALGAGPWQMASVFLAEPVVLSIVGGLLSAIVATVCLAGLQQLDLSDFPGAQAVRLQPSIVLYAFSACAGSALVAGMLPMFLQRKRVALVASGSGRGSTTPSNRAALHTLLILEIAMTVILITSAISLGRGFVRLSASDWGFNPSGVVAMKVALPPAIRQERHAHAAYTEAVLRALNNIPAVDVAATSYGVPIRWDRWEQARPVVGGAAHPAGIWTVGDGYFEALGIPILQGRALTRDDGGSDARAAVVNESFARAAWPSGNAVGSTFMLSKMKRDVERRVVADPMNPQLRALLLQSDSYTVAPPEFSVVGVVPDVRMFGLADSTGPAIYLHLETRDNRFSEHQYFLVRAKEESSALASMLRESTTSADPRVAVESIFSMDQIVHGSVGGRGSLGLLTAVSAMIGGVAMLLAGCGLYGVASLVVTSRLKEIAIRTALGAGTARTAEALLRPHVRAVFIGLSVGLIATYLFSSVLRAVPVGLESSPSEALLIYSAAAALVVLLSAAALAPAVATALRVAPADLLRTSE